MEELIWTIENFESSSGEKVIDEFIKKQQPKTIAKIVHAVKLLKQYGNKLSLPHSRALGSGLFELRTRGKEEIRIFYCFTANRIIYLLHCFKKKAQETPQKELNIALDRMKSLTFI